MANESISLSIEDLTKLLMDRLHISEQKAKFLVMKNILSGRLKTNMNWGGTN
jgi:hypothetical protein